MNKLTSQSINQSNEQQQHQEESKQTIDHSINQATGTKNQSIYFSIKESINQYFSITQSAINHSIINQLEQTINQ